MPVDAKSRIDGGRQLSFAQAVQHMLNGGRVRRRAFTADKCYVSLSTAQTGQLIVHNQLGGFAYELQPDDLMATDWYVVESD